MDPQFRIRKMGSQDAYVSWNDKVGRYQEFAANEDPPGFKAELKTPRHIHSGENHR